MVFVGIQWMLVTTSEVFMELVGIESLQPGFVIGADVANPSGALLCPRGFVLTEEAIERLRSTGIEAVMVESAPAEQVAHIDRRLQRLERRFEGVDSTVLLELKEIVVRRLEKMRMEVQ